MVGEREREWILGRKEREQEEEEEEGYLSYTLHDVIMAYLKNNITLEEQKRYHLQLVQKYSDKCGGTFAELEDDGYIHQHLLMHVHAADNMKLLGQLLTNLLWVAACCEHWYASALLDSCKRYQSFVPKEVRCDTCTLNVLYMCTCMYRMYYSIGGAHTLCYMESKPHSR